MEIGNYYSFANTNLTSNQSSLIIAGKGILGEFTIQTAWASGTIILYDGLNATGNQLVKITFPATLLTNGPFAPICRFNRFSQGLFLVTTGTGGIINTSHHLGN